MKRITLLHLFLSGAVLVATLGAVKARAAAGDLFVTDNTNEFGNSIFKFTPAGTRSTFASGFLIPEGLAFDLSGNLFVADAGDGTISKFTPTETKSTFASGLSVPGGLAFDGSGNLFVADSGSGTICELTSAGTKSTFASGLSQPVSLAFDASGNLFIADAGTGTIFKFTPTGTKSTFASGLNDPDGLAFDSAGNLFEADNVSGTIFKFTPDGNKSTFASGLGNVHGLAVDSSGNLFVASAGTIFKFTPAGAKSTFASAFGSFLAFEPVTEKVRNISARGFVQTGENVLIGGFILGGNGLATNAVVVRAIGPSLSHFGIANPLQDPTLEVHNGSGALLASNNNWQDTQAAQIMATGLAPTDPHESAIFATLPAGNFTAIVRGVSDTTGVALVEIYNLSN